MAQPSGGECMGTTLPEEPWLIGRCPAVEISVIGVTVACLLNTGSMLTTVTFFEQQLQLSISDAALPFT